MHTAPPASYLGTQLDRRYRLDRLIGEGGMAWVFAAHDLRLERDVAVKVVKPWLADEQTAQRKRFVTEGRTLAKLVHPHVVLVHDAGETDDGIGYLVMELSDAGNLENELFRRGSLPAGECLRLLLPLLGALACAHDRGIVHRDIKPANIALVHERRETKAKLLDFGIAKRRDAAGSTDPGRGTPSYMAPEQARGEVLSPAGDVWALGVVFFRCLSGRMPFASDTSLGMLLKLVYERAPHFADACPKLGPHLAVALDRALEPDVARRYADMRCFAHALASAAAQDGIELPHAPEPIGLPDFAQWLASADVMSTRPLGGISRARTALSAAPSALSISRPWRAGLTVAVFAAVVLGTAFGQLSAGRVVSDGVATALRPTRAAVSERPAAPLAASLPSLSEVPPLAAAPLLETLEPKADQEQTVPSPRTSKTGFTAAKQRTSRARQAPRAQTLASANPEPSESPNAPAPGSTSAKPALMTAWEW